MLTLITICGDSTKVTYILHIKLLYLMVIYDDFCEKIM